MLKNKPKMGPKPELSVQMVKDVDPQARIAEQAGFPDLQSAAAEFQKSQQYKLLKAMADSGKVPPDELKAKFKLLYMQFMANPDTRRRFGRQLGQETAGDRYAALKAQMGAS
jgi:hypothetical protein